MRIIVLSALIFLSVSAAQTPFEFGVVQDLVQGEPFVSVISIKLTSGAPAPGNTLLEMAFRAGLTFEGETNAFLPDSSLPGNVGFQGQIVYRGLIPVSAMDRVFSVIRSNMAEFPGTGITHVDLDLVSTDDMSWVSIRAPLARIDSLLAGSIDHLEFWRRTAVWELEVGTYAMPVTADAPTLLELTVRPADTLAVDRLRSSSASAHAWKSLVLPGWGQLSSGRGIGWLNLLVEAGGIALILTENEEAGAAVLGVNHLISFTDLL